MVDCDNGPCGTPVRNVTIPDPLTIMISPHVSVINHDPYGQKLQEGFQKYSKKIHYQPWHDKNKLVSTANEAMTWSGYCANDGQSLCGDLALEWFRRSQVAEQQYAQWLVDQLSGRGDGAGDPTPILIAGTPILKNLVGGNSDAASRGQAVHSGQDWKAAREKNNFLPGRQYGDRIPDAIGTTNGIDFPVELKPDTRSGIRAGQRGLRAEMEAMGAEYGELWTYSVDRAGGVTFQLRATPIPGSRFWQRYP
jgi:hypothetical protein